jgi:hypothetical protein
MSKKKTGAGRRKAEKKGREIRLSQHPRAQRSIGLAKSYAGLGAFLFAGYAQWSAGGAFLDVATRALVWGMAAYVLVWALAVHVWRHLAVAEVRAAERRWRQQQGGGVRDDEQVAKLTKILDDNGLPTTGTGMPPG